jgi:hypothetical protein
MALNQLATLTRCAEMIKDLLKPDTDMPEWVQSKITLATDYIQTAADYMYSEMKEEVEQIEETKGAQAMKASGVKQSPDKLRARTGMNLAHKFPRKGQTDLGNIPAMNTPGNSPETDAFAKARRGDREKQLKPAIKAALGTHGPKGKLPEEVELNEVSKSEVDHHFNQWSNSEHAPYNSDAGDDKKVHQSAMSYLRSTNVPKEKHEKLAMHIADKFHGSGIDEEKKMTDAEMAKREKIVKSMKKGFAGFRQRYGKDAKSVMYATATKQAMKEDAVEEEIDPKVRTKDTLKGQERTAQSDDVGPDSNGRSTKVKFRGGPMKEEVKKSDIPAFIRKARGDKPLTVADVKSGSKDSISSKENLAKARGVQEGKHPESDTVPFVTNAEQPPFDGPYKKIGGTVTDKSGAKHTPMSRAKDLARQAMKRIKTEMIGKAPGNNG